LESLREAYIEVQHSLYYGDLPVRKATPDASPDTYYTALSLAEQIEAIF
jgi:hypothetical protein